MSEVDQEQEARGGLPVRLRLASLETLLLQGERASAELGWTVPSVNWRDDLRAIRRLFAAADLLTRALEDACGSPADTTEGATRHE